MVEVLTKRMKKKKKVWDRRCFTREKPAGVLAGHLDGITHIDSRGDGRYLISNGKDQTIKLWDIRKMSSSVKLWVPSLHKIDLYLSIYLYDSALFFLFVLFSSLSCNLVTFWCCSSSIPRAYDWDYRWMVYPSEARHMKHPHDQSLATFRGHSVLRTLIRCYFSPAHRFVHPSV